MNTFSLEILTPERQFYKGEVESLIVTTPDGQMCVLAGHVNLVAPLVVGSLKIRSDGVVREAFNSEGFMEVTQEGTVLFTQVCEWPDEIDVRRAEEALHRAQEQLRQKRSLAEYRQSQISLARAMARLRITKLRKD